MKRITTDHLKESFNAALKLKSNKSDSFHCLSVCVVLICLTASQSKHRNTLESAGETQDVTFLLCFLSVCEFCNSRQLRVRIKLSDPIRLGSETGETLYRLITVMTVV